MMTIDFDASTHSYRLDGRAVPSVTQVLEDVGIIDYSVMRPEHRDLYLARGYRVHLATQFDDDGDLDESTVSDIDRPFIDAWRTFRRVTGFVVSASELRVANPHYGYAGTLDVIGYFPSAPNVVVIVDKKTGHAEWWTKIQTAAYAGCLDDSRKYRRICVELHANGTFSVPPHLDRSGRDWHEEFQDFVAALRVVYAKRMHQPSSPPVNNNNRQEDKHTHDSSNRQIHCVGA